jgi:hypothetical protein
MERQMLIVLVCMATIGGLGVERKEPQIADTERIVRTGNEVSLCTAQHSPSLFSCTKRGDRPTARILAGGLPPVLPPGLRQG